MNRSTIEIMVTTIASVIIANLVLDLILVKEKNGKNE
tara:strand:- start:832 stop:942 length:111 start_codon:yes stop_codon:yes gene_type:complete